MIIRLKHDSITLVIKKVLVGILLDLDCVCFCSLSLPIRSMQSTAVSDELAFVDDAPLLGAKKDFMPELSRLPFFFFVDICRYQIL